MSILTWRPVRPGDARGFQEFCCTAPAKRSRRPPYGRQHHAQWELQVQSYIRALKPRTSPNCHLWVGLDAEGVAGVFHYERVGGTEVFVKCAAIAVRHRRKGGGVADELLTTMLDEITARAIEAGERDVLVTGHIHPENRPSQYLARRTGFRQIACLDEYQVWAMTLDLPPDLFQMVLLDA